MYEFDVIRYVDKKIDFVKLTLEIKNKVYDKFNDLIFIENVMFERKFDKVVITFCKRNFTFYFHEIESLINVVDNVIYNYQKKSSKLKI